MGTETWKVSLSQGTGGRGRIDHGQGQIAQRKGEGRAAPETERDLGFGIQDLEECGFGRAVRAEAGLQRLEDAAVGATDMRQA